MDHERERRKKSGEKKTERNNEGEREKKIGPSDWNNLRIETLVYNQMEAFTQMKAFTENNWEEKTTEITFGQET